MIRKPETGFAQHETGHLAKPEINPIERFDSYQFLQRHNQYHPSSHEGIQGAGR